MKFISLSLQDLGYGEVDHYPEIVSEDLRRLSVHFRNYGQIATPTGLQEKVQFDIRFYFCRRGLENLHDMTKDTFRLRRDPSDGTEYISLASNKSDKNHNAKDKELVTGFMPASKSPLCPVSSFKRYMSKLHPDIPNLFQKPRDLRKFHINDAVWYCKIPIGEPTLSKFMPELSKKAELSERYVNHSIRATGITLLNRAGFCEKQIMSVSGHKSVASMAIYEKVSGGEKMSMGRALARALDDTAKPHQPVQSTSSYLPEDPLYEPPSEPPGALGREFSDNPQQRPKRLSHQPGPSTYQPEPTSEPEEIMMPKYEKTSTPNVSPIMEPVMSIVSPGNHGNLSLLNDTGNFSLLSPFLRDNFSDYEDDKKPLKSLNLHNCKINHITVQINNTVRK